MGTAEVYRRYADGPAGSPLSARIARAVADSPEALRAVEAAPARRRAPALVLAALHDLALAGQAPQLAAAYATDAAAEVAIDTLVRMTDAVVAAATRRPVLEATGHCAVLYPLVAEAARRAGASAVGLVDVGSPVALNLNVDRVGVTLGDGKTLGDSGSPVQVSAEVRGRAVPARAVPEVVTRVAVDPDPVDVTDAEAVRWLRACLPPDRPERRARLDAELALAAASPPELLRGAAVEVLPDALARVPAGALPVVTTTWALARFPPASRLRFLERLDEAATSRPVAWVSVEGVGVAPAVPTMGDRRASGHSILGLTLLEHRATHAEAVGRCWSRGRIVSWLA